MMTCEEAAQLVSEERDHPLSLRARIGLRMHLALCVLCRGYRRQLAMLGRIAATAGEMVASRQEAGAGEELPPLPPESKERIKRNLSNFRT